MQKFLLLSLFPVLMFFPRASLGFASAFSKLPFSGSLRLDASLNRFDSSSRRVATPLLVTRGTKDISKPAPPESQATNFLIRKAEPKDMPEASRILTDGFFKNNTNCITYHWEWLETYLSLTALFPRPTEPHEIFVACANDSGKVLGLVEIDAREKAGGRCSHGPYMCNLAVDENHKRRGIGTKLVEQVEHQVIEWFRNSDDTPKLFLKVRQTSPAAIFMYEKLGYDILWKERDPKGTKIVVMSRKLRKAAI